jgi:serine phosphatase RsbU (regulator of sigma subunit)
MPKEPIRILIVEDSQQERERLRQLLEQPTSRKYKEIVVFEADTGEAGHAFCRTKQPHCVLLDCHLPDLNGVQFLTRLRNGVGSFALPAVILVASQGGEAVAAEAIRHGAVGYLVREQVTAEGLNTSIRKAVAGVKRRKRGSDASRRLSHARAQLHAAGEVQCMLLPQHPPQVSGLDIAAACRPASETGGDFFDYPKLADGAIGIVMGDVSGHGLGPAILAADTRAYIRAFARTHTSPGEILAHTNRLLCEDTKGERFVTLFFASIQAASRRMRFASAGHRGFFLDRHGTVTTIESQQPPLGLAPAFIRAFESEIGLQTGGLLLLMTDGITEAPSTHKVPRSHLTMFGDERALDTVRDCRHCSATEITRRLLDCAREFTKDGSQDDDMTMVVVKVLDC